MPNFEIYYYVDEKGTAPVREYILNLPEGQRVKAFSFIHFLSDQGYKVRRPFADYLGDQTGLYELRPKPSRIIYFFTHRDKIVLLHAFTKKTKAIPERELRIALDRKENCDILIKFNRAEFEGETRLSN